LNLCASASFLKYYQAQLASILKTSNPIGLDSLLQMNATIIAGVLVLASVASIFQVEPLDFRGIINSDPTSEDENRKELTERVSIIPRSGVILLITGALVAPFAISIILILAGRAKAGKVSMCVGVGLLVTLLMIFGTIFAWFGSALDELMANVL
jgi:hypothetical protein